MKRVLFVGKTSKLNNAYALNLNVQLGVQVIFKNKLTEAYDYLKGGGESVNLIIISAMTNDKKSSLEMYKWLTNTNTATPILSLEGNEIIERVMFSLPPNTDIQSIVNEAGRILNITPCETEGETPPEFYAIPIKYYYFIEEIACDTYLCVKKDNGPDHYIMRFRKGDMYSRQEIKQFFERGINYFYVRYDDRLYFVNEVTQSIIDKLNDDEAEDYEKMRLVENCRDVISGLLLTRGMTEETVSIAKASMKKVVELASHSSKLSHLLDQLLLSKTSFRYRRTQLVTYVTFHIIANMEWGSQEQQEKLAFVAFFHDITLLSDKLAVIESESDILKVPLSAENERIVLYHARDAAELVKDFPRAPIGAETIITRHHGTLGGMGFAKTYSNNLEPLTIVFIVAEKYVNYLLKNFGQMTNTEILEQLFDDFPKAHYKRVIRTLVNLEF